MSLSSISSTRQPQITPVIFEALGCIIGACTKKISNQFWHQFAVEEIAYCSE
jgi:hypothetical protein